MAAGKKLGLRMKVIYLVAQGEASGAEIRVTERGDGPTRPRTCKFLSLGLDERANPLGTLVLTEERWQEWYGDVDKAQFCPGMDTAASAAARMVKNNPRIFYGCPLCNFRTKDVKAAHAHAEQEAARIEEFYEVQ